MAALITAGGDADTGNTAATGPVRLIASGLFNQATVSVTLTADSLRAAIVHTFNGQGAITIDSVTGQTVTVTIFGGNATTSIDVSAL